MSDYPRRNDSGETVWACCESSIGPTCQHKRPRCPLCGVPVEKHPGQSACDRYPTTNTPKR